MNCRRVVNLMSAYVDGELTGEEMLGIRRHLSECDECAQEHESIRMTKMVLVRLRTAAPRPDLAASILKQLDEVGIPCYLRVTNSVVRFLHEKLSPVAAALAVSGAALVIMSATGIDKMQPLAGAAQTAGAPSQSVPFVHNAPNSMVEFTSSQPLKLAEQTPEFAGSKLVYASLITR